MAYRWWLNCCSQHPNTRGTLTKSSDKITYNFIIYIAIPGWGIDGFYQVDCCLLPIHQFESGINLMNITEVQSSSIFPKFLFRNHLDILPKIAQGVAQGVKDREKTLFWECWDGPIGCPTELEDIMWGKNIHWCSMVQYYQYYPTRNDSKRYDTVILF